MNDNEALEIDQPPKQYPVGFEMRSDMLTINEKLDRILQELAEIKRSTARGIF